MTAHDPFIRASTQAGNGAENIDGWHIAPPSASRSASRYVGDGCDDRFMGARDQHARTGAIIKPAAADGKVGSVKEHPARSREPTHDRFRFALICVTAEKGFVGSRNLTVAGSCSHAPTLLAWYGGCRKRRPQASLFRDRHTRPSECHDAMVPELTPTS